MKLTLFSGFYILMIICISCKKKEINIRTEPVVPVIQVPLPDQITFSHHQITDKRISLKPAFEYILPSNWKVKEQIIWDSADSRFPPRYVGDFNDSIGKLNIHAFADSRYTYTIGPRGLHGKKPPINILDGLKELIKKERSNKSYKIIDEHTLQAPVSGSVHSGDKDISENTEHGLIRIEYLEKNEKIEETFIGQLEIAKLSSQTLFDLHTTNWSLNDIYSFRAPKSRVDFCKMIALTLRASNKPTLSYFSSITQLSEMLNQNSGHQSMKSDNVDQLLSKLDDGIPSNISDQYKNLQRQNLANQTLFGKYIGGIELYKDDNLDSILLPSGYNRAWKKDSGDYLLSKIEGYEPEINSENNWKLLEKF